MRYFLAVFLGILLTIVVGAFVLKDKVSFQITQKGPEASVLASPSLMPSATPAASMKTISGGGILSFPKFDMTVPSDWTEKRETGTDMERLTLSSGGYSISILEGGFGGAICLFPGDADVEGPSARFTEFTDITTKSGNMFRRVSSTGTGFGVCEKTQYGWGEPTTYGAISISTPSSVDPAVVKVIDGILSSIVKK